VAQVAEVARARSTTTLDEVERMHIEQAILSHGSVTEAARSLGIPRSSLYLKLKAHGIQPPRTHSSQRIKVSGTKGE
jgi:transcriptional regulator of acetoin/glycerol metabolism